MRSIVSAYVREFGALNLIADALAIATVFALLGAASAYPVASSPSGLTQPPETADASSGNGEQAK